MNDRNELVVSARPERMAEGVAVRMAAPAPGTYWTARKQIASKHTNRRRCPEIPAGTVLMIESIESADGAAHVYHFAAHPEWDEDDSAEFHADDFFLLFEPCANGEAHRERELMKLLSDMGDTQALMLAPPPKAAPAGLLAHAPELGSNEPGTALATTADVANIEAYAENVKADAEARSQWIQTHSATLAEQGAALGRYHAERAVAALAHAQSQLESVQGLLRTVENLSLYTGKGVVIEQLRDGEPAAPAATLTIWQECLAFDQETGALLDSGGLDHTRVDVLMDAVQDMALVARMIPSERGIVMCQFRAKDKRFFPGNDAGTALANAMMNARSKQHALLLRDGEKLWLVYIEGVLQSIDQLMPSEREQQAHFADPWNRRERVTAADLDYARAQRRQMGALDSYGKVLIVLWGLRDRAQVLGDSAIPHFTNWLDPAFQTQYLALVSHDNMIGLERPDYREWAAEQNKYLSAGSWVAIDLREAFDYESAPGAFGKGYYDSLARKTRYNQIYVAKPTGDGEAGDIFFARLRSDAKGLWVSVPCAYDGFHDGSAKNIKLYVLQRQVGRRDALTSGVLAMDRAVAADMDYYLTSRKQRRDYAQYLKLFRAARAWVRERDAREAPLRRALMQALADGRIAFDPDMIDGEITEALAIARASRRGDEIPEFGTPAFKAFWRGALSTLHAQLTGHGERVRAIDEWAAACGRVPIRLVLTGSGEFKIYLEPVDVSREIGLLRALSHAELALVRFGGDGVDVQPGVRTLLRPERGHHVVHDWESSGGDAGSRAADWLARMPSFNIDHSKMTALQQLPSKAELPRELTHPTVAAVESIGRWMHRVSAGSVVRKRVTVPIGLGHCRYGPRVIFASVDLLLAMHAAGDRSVKDAVRSVIEGIYKNPERSLERLREPLSWDLGRAGLDYVWQHREDLAELQLESLTEEVCRMKKRDSWSEPFTVDEVNPIGVSLFPWLAEVTRGPSPSLEGRGGKS